MVAEATTITWVLVGTDRGVTEAAIGVLVACATFPQILLAPWIGRLADRSRRPALLLGLLTGIGALGFAGIGIGLGSIPIGVLFVVAVLVAVGEPAMMGALSGIASRSIDVSKFEAWDAASYGGAAIGAQLAVVVAVALWSSSAAVLVIGLLAVVAVTTVARLPLRPVHIHLLEPTTIGSVLSFMVRDRAIRSITVLTTISMSAFGGVALVAVDLAERSGRPADAGSHLILAMAIGAAVGAVVCIRLPPPQSPLRQAVVSVFVLGGAFAASAISWPVAFVSFADRRVRRRSTPRGDVRHPKQGHAGADARLAVHGRGKSQDRGNGARRDRDRTRRRCDRRRNRCAGARCAPTPRPRRLRVLSRPIGLRRVGNDDQPVGRTGEKRGRNGSARWLRQRFEAAAASTPTTAAAARPQAHT